LIDFLTPRWLQRKWTAWSSASNLLSVRCAQEQIKKLEKNHAKHIAAYGEGNERRLTGKHETSSMCDHQPTLSPSRA
jgi:hypothetical protein